VLPLRLHLPPNLPAAAARDGVAVKMELDLSLPPPAELLPALAILSRWADGKGTAFLQLRRGQLRELIAAARGLPVFFRADKPGAAFPWQGEQLIGVSAHLAEPAPAATAFMAESAAGKTEPGPSASRGPARGEARPGVEPMTVDGSEQFLAIVLPSREHPRYADAVELLKNSGFILEPSNRKWWLRDRHKTLSFLASHGARLREDFGARFTPNFVANTARLTTTEIVCKAAVAGDGFNVTIGLNAGPAGDVALREAIAAGRGYLEAEGRVFLIDPARLNKLAEAQKALTGGLSDTSHSRTHRISLSHAAEVEEVLEELAPGFQPPAAWSAKTAALRNLSQLEPAPVPPALEAQMRPYQRMGAAWLWHLHRNGLGGILADEMGLGKTVQALALLSAQLRPGAPILSLVVCPASLVENWRREAARFAPQLRVMVHHGARRVSRPEEFAGWDLAITSYGTLSRDRDLFAGMEFGCVVGDEAQHVKNRRSQNAQALRALRARGRFLLTGTPVENSLDDLRSLFEFILPGYIERVPAGTRGDERAWLDQRLGAKAAPYILRRTKQAVAPELPLKIEQVIWCELSPGQADLYRATQEKSERDLFDLAAGGAAESRLRLAALTQLLRLRQICCDPRLVGAEDSPPREAGALPEAFGGSAKLEAFRELLAEAVDDGHRMLVFSQFTSLLSLLRAELETQGVGYCYLDGSMAPAARQAEVDRFQTSSDLPVFLLSLKAGGAGLNLTAADTVVHFDPWWNPAVEAQATDRAHRIGQSRVVTSYKLVCSGTVEEKVLGLQAEKRALLADVFEASAAEAAKLSLADLKSLLQA
jgi:superfamily II DNA or RNA helicase